MWRHVDVIRRRLGWKLEVHFVVLAWSDHQQYLSVFSKEKTALFAIKLHTHFSEMNFAIQERTQLLKMGTTLPSPTFNNFNTDRFYQTDNLHSGNWSCWVQIWPYFWANSFTVIMARSVKIRDTISKQECKNFTYILIVLQVFKVNPPEISEPTNSSYRLYVIDYDYNFIDYINALLYMYIDYLRLYEISFSPWFYRYQWMWQTYRRLSSQCYMF